jgi:uncharacterized membrane protein
VFRRAGLVGPDDPVNHVLAALVGAAALLAGLRVLHRFASAAHAVGVAATGGEQSAGLEDRIRQLGDIERRILHAVLSRERLTRDPNQAFEEHTSFGERTADLVARFGGSWTFIGLFGVVMIAWITLNERTAQPFDPYPFILLNLVLSCLAALQAPVIMMSQNRQSAKDRWDAKMDYEVNVRAELEITAMHAKLDLLREEQFGRLIALVERHQEVLDDLQRRVRALPGAGPEL